MRSKTAALLTSQCNEYVVCEVRAMQVIIECNVVFELIANKVDLNLNTKVMN